MGYCISQIDGSFKMKKENQEPAYKAVKSQMANQSYHWQEKGWFKGCRDIYAVFEEFLYTPELDDDTGDIINLEFSAEKAGDELELFKVIAPYVEPGSYLEMSGEDGSVWRWVFDGKTCTEKYANMDYGDEKPQEETFTLLVWETIPEETDFYLIPNTEAEKYRDYLKQAHHKFINAQEMNEGMAFLNTALADEDGVAEGGMCAYLSCFKQYKVDHKKPLLDKHITAVYLSGFVL